MGTEHLNSHSLTSHERISTANHNGLAVNVHTADSGICGSTAKRHGLEDGSTVSGIQGETLNPHSGGNILLHLLEVHGQAVVVVSAIG